MGSSGRIVTRYTCGSSGASEASDTYCEIIFFFILFYYFVIRVVFFLCKIGGGGGVSKMGENTKNGGEGG